MSRYIKQAEGKSGSVQIRIDPVGKEPYFVDITNEAQPFDDGVAASILSGYEGLVVEVAVEDVPLGFLADEDLPEIESVRFACEVEDCGKDYVSQKNLDKHAKGVHGNLLERLVTPKVVDDDTAKSVASE